MEHIHWNPTRLTQLNKHQKFCPKSKTYSKENRYIQNITFTSTPRKYKKNDKKQKNDSIPNKLGSPKHPLRQLSQLLHTIHSRSDNHCHLFLHKKSIRRINDWQRNNVANALFPHLPGSSNTEHTTSSISWLSSLSFNPWLKNWQNVRPQTGVIFFSQTKKRAQTEFVSIAGLKTKSVPCSCSRLSLDGSLEKTLPSSSQKHSTVVFWKLKSSKKE